MIFYVVIFLVAFLVTFGIHVVTDRQTDRKRCIRAHRALAQVGSKNGCYRSLFIKVLPILIDIHINKHPEVIRPFDSVISLA